MEADNPLVKELLEKTLLHSLDSYDVIGFDIDHCLVQYNVPNLNKMTYDVLTNVLISEKGYSAQLKDITEEQLNSPLNSCICDFKTGCLLKLGVDNEILRAYRGFRRLSKEEVNIF